MVTYGPFNYGKPNIIKVLEANIMAVTVGFHHGALADTYEEQANAQGFTFGDKAEWIEEVGKGMVCLWIHGCLTDGEYNKVLQRFQKKILVPNLKRKVSK